MPRRPIDRHRQRLVRTGGKGVQRLGAREVHAPGRYFLDLLADRTTPNANLGADSLRVGRVAA